MPLAHVSGLCCLLVLLGTACSGETDPRRSDENPFAPTSFIVDSTPSLLIRSEGNPEYEFAEIVAFGRFESGAWYVVDRGTRDIRYFNDAGELLRSVGRSGEGPGEYQYILGASSVGDDDLLVYDAMVRRLTLLDGRGRVSEIRDVPAQPSGSSAFNPIGFLPTGDVILSTFKTGPCQEGRVVTDTLAYMHLRAIGRDVMDTVAIAAGRQRWGNRINVLKACFVNVVPFTRPPVAAAVHGHLYLALQDLPIIRIIDLHSGDERRIPLDLDRTPVTPELIGSYIERELGTAARDERGREMPMSFGTAEYARRLRESPYPDSLPYFGQLVVDPQRYMWLALYAPLGSSVVTWQVMGETGELLEQLQLPANYRVTEVGLDYIAGVLTDSLEVQWPVVHPLTRIVPSGHDSLMRVTH